MSIFHKDTYRILQSDRDEIIRERRKMLLIVTFVLMVSAALFSYPIVKDYKTKWDARKAARKIALFLMELKTQAMIKHVPIEARFIEPDIIEISEVSTCGPNARRTKLWDKSISEFQRDIHFVAPATIRKLITFNEPILDRFCYDPIYGSSLHADGIAYGSFFVAHVSNLSKYANLSAPSDEFEEDLVELSISGASGAVDIF